MNVLQVRHSLLPTATAPPPGSLGGNFPPRPRVGRPWRRGWCPLGRFPSRALSNPIPTDSLLPAAPLSLLPLSQGASPGRLPRRDQFLPPSGAARQGHGCLPPSGQMHFHHVIGRSGNPSPPPQGTPRAGRGSWGLWGGADVHVGSRYRARRSLHTEATFSVAVLLLASRPTSDVWLRGRAAPSCFVSWPRRAWAQASAGPAGHRPGPGGHPELGGQQPRPRMGWVGCLDNGAVGRRDVTLAVLKPRLAARCQAISGAGLATQRPQPPLAAATFVQLALGGPVAR